MNKSVKRVYVGDIGEIVVKAPITPITEHIDIDRYTNRGLFKILLDHGVDVRLLCGIETCDKHVNMVLVGANKLPDGMNWCDDMRYCNNCWQWFRWKV